jgi:hypothetical protein
MLAIGLTVFVHFPGNSAQRVLHPCLVTQINGSESMTILPEDQTLQFEVEQEFLIFYEKQRKFMQQPAKVEALLDIDSGSVVALQTIGEPVSAESRQCYRVSTVISDLLATFDGHENCSLRDVSVTGFAVTSPGSYRLGQVLDAELLYEGKRFKGQASVQSVSPAADGLTRYGVNCMKSAPGPNTLTKGVQCISMAVQRQQLSRLAGGA